MKRTDENTPWLMVITWLLLLQGCFGHGCAVVTDLLTRDARIPDPLGIHVHPVMTTTAEVREVCETTGRVRMEVPDIVVEIVVERVQNAPSDCRFLLVVEESLPMSWWAWVRAEPRVEAIQVGNELNNCGEGWPCWDSTQTELWLRVNVPRIRQAAGSKPIVCPAATPLFSDPEAMAWYARLADTGVLNLCDVQAVHIYGKPWTSPEKWQALTDEVHLLARVGLPVWVTEYGTPEDAEEVEYAARIPALFEARGMTVERWYWYAWNDPTLGFELRTGPSPLWKELQ